MADDYGDYMRSSKTEIAGTHDAHPGKRESKGAIGLSMLRNSSGDVYSPNTSGAWDSRGDSSMGRSTSRLSFFRTLIGQRNDDYRSDAPQEVEVQRSHASSMDDSKQRHGNSNRNARSTRWSLRPTTLSEQETVPASFFQRCKRCCRSVFSPSPAALDRMAGVIQSKPWHAGLLFFTVVLLFGSQVQELWCPKGSDTFFDVLFFVDFVYLFVDIIMRSFVEPAYFAFDVCRRSDDERGSCRSFRVGSFMFWCDVISTSLLLWDISFIRKDLKKTPAVNLTVDSFGLTVGGIDGINSAIPIRWEPSLLVTILRTTRVARFIRASTVVKTSSFVNWYWLIQSFNPFWYIETIRRRRMKKRKAEREPETDGEADETGDLGTDKPKWIRRSSWGEVALGATAVVQAKEQSGKNDRGLKGAVKSGLVFLRLLPNEEKKLKEQIVAATKIQRAWRKHGASEANATNREVNVVESWNTDDQAQASPSQGYATGEKNSLGKSLRRSLELPGRMPEKKLEESQVGSAMRELTGQRVAIGVIVAMILTVLFTYSEKDATRPSTMIVLHGQTANDDFASRALDAARSTSIPDLYSYSAANGTTYEFELDGENPDDLRNREKLIVAVTGNNNQSVFDGTTTGHFSNRQEIRDRALVELLTTFFILFIWFFGVTAFAGPVMTLVVIPIERMVRLLSMLMVDPLGYQSSPRYKKFVNEEDELTKNSRWTKEILKGMETSFLMSTITRIGSLMKVGFGSAGVEIIRNNLEKGQRKDTLILNSQGSTVACIFLFCDIRQFTDATESLQEEVFLFTNKIAAVVHSICHSYNGSANKNVGDAFLLSWLLEDEGSAPASTTFSGSASPTEDTFTSKNNQADKALLSVVKINIALQHDNYYIESMSSQARDALLAKLSKRKGPVVQMGFGLHAGKAIQGALGSQRKIDATYVSEAVERAEFLESSTKKYGVKILMSNNFHRLLHPNNRRRCRKVDQILINKEDDADSPYEGDVMELFTFDMDIDALWRNDDDKMSDVDSINESVISGRGSKRDPRSMLLPRRRSLRRLDLKGFNASSSGFDVIEDAAQGLGLDSADVGAQTTRVVSGDSGEDGEQGHSPPELVLPTGPALYNSNVWQSEEMRKIRQRYSDGLFFQKFKSGLQSYYAKDWDHAKQCFQSILERFEDGPSRYFLRCMEEHDGVPPKRFIGYGTG